MKIGNFSKQKGLSFWGFVWGAAMVVCMSYILILSIPPYLDNRKLYYALESLAEEPGVLRMQRHSMISLLNKKLNIDYADDIVNLNNAFRVRNVDGNKEFSIDYELVVPVFYNISLLFDFENQVLTNRK